MRQYWAECFTVSLVALPQSSGLPPTPVPSQFGAVRICWPSPGTWPHRSTRRVLRPCAPRLRPAAPLHATLAIAGVEPDGVVPEQLPLGGLRQVPAQYGLHRLGKPALPMGVIGGIHHHVLP